MAQDCMPLPLLDFKAMRSVEAARGREAKDNHLTLQVFFDRVADRSVSTDRTDCEGPVETHWRPFFHWPQAIAAAGKRIDQRANGGQGQCEDAFVHISDLHEMKAQSLFGRALFGRSAGLQHMKFFAGLEAHCLAGCDADLGTGAGIAADTSFAGPNAEDAEAAQFDAFAGGESLFETLEDRIYGSLCLSSGETRALDDMMNDVLLDQRGTSLACLG